MTIFQGFLDVLSYVLSWVVGFLPDSPFQMISNSAIAPYIGYLNWILPISECLAILEAWLIAVVVYYGYQVILRWVKALG